MDFENLWTALAGLPEVEAIALAGSRASDHFDEKSDYDLYVYVTKLPDEKIRKEILKKSCSYLEMSNTFWELEDDCTLNNGIDIDILYRNLDDFEAGIFKLLNEFCTSNGYSTCMWHNLLHSKILYDRNGRFETLQKQGDVEYPELLAKAIVKRNMKLLKGHLPSYDGQLKKAASRRDLPSMNHRLAAWMESLFDVLFALNRLSHPGEKRMVEYLVEQASWLPENFEENLTAIFENLYSDPERSLEIMEQITLCLEKRIEETEG